MEEETNWVAQDIVTIAKRKDKSVLLYKTDIVTERSKPLPLVQYNVLVKGLDRHDQIMSLSLWAKSLKMV